MGARRVEISGVYAITAPSGSCYIGSTKSMRQRWSAHRKALERGDHHNEPLQRAAAKYGLEALQFQVIIRCRPEDMTLYEQIAMDALKPDYNTLAFARTPLGRTLSPQTRAKIATSRVGKPRPPGMMAVLCAGNVGRKRDPAVIATVAEKIRGQKRTAAQIANMQVAQRALAERRRGAV